MSLGRLYYNMRYPHQEEVRKVVWAQDSSYYYISTLGELFKIINSYCEQQRMLIVPEVLDAVALCDYIYVLKSNMVCRLKIHNGYLEPLCFVPEKARYIDVKQMDPFTNILRLW